MNLLTHPSSLSVLCILSYPLVTSLLHTSNIYWRIIAFWFQLPDSSLGGFTRSISRWCPNQDVFSESLLAVRFDISTNKLLMASLLPILIHETKSNIFPDNLEFGAHDVIVPLNFFKLSGSDEGLSTTFPLYCSSLTIFFKSSSGKITQVASNILGMKITYILSGWAVNDNIIYLSHNFYILCTWVAI